MLNNNKVLLVLSLLLSICLWVYVMGNVDPAIDSRINNVNIEMTGQDELALRDSTAELEGSGTVNFVVVGKRSEINKAKKKGFEAIADVSECHKGRNDVKVQIMIPDGITGVAVDSISKETVSVMVR